MVEKKTLSDLQLEVDTYINQFKEGYFPPMELLARLTEELGSSPVKFNISMGQRKRNLQKWRKKLRMRWEISFSYYYVWQMQKV